MLRLARGRGPQPRQRRGALRRRSRLTRRGRWGGRAPMVRDTTKEQTLERCPNLALASAFFCPRD